MGCRKLNFRDYLSFHGCKATEDFRFVETEPSASSYVEVPRELKSVDRRNSLNQLTSETKMKRNGHRMFYSYEYSFNPAGNRTALRRELHQQPVFAEGDKLKNENKNICGLESSGHVCNHVSCENKKTKPTFWDLPNLKFCLSREPQNFLKRFL